MRFEKVGLLYSAPMATPAPVAPAHASTSLDDYVLTVQVLLWLHLL